MTTFSHEPLLAAPTLDEIWAHLTNLPRLGQIAETSRGLEWKLPLRIKGEETGNREKYVLGTPQPWTREGVPPLTKISCFQKPETKHLSMITEDQRPWDKPKVILNAARRSRGPWRISAFADFNGLTCYRTFLGVWPHDPAFTTVLAAVLNGPVANAFSATETLRTLPVPTFSDDLRRKTEGAVRDYQDVVAKSAWEAADAALRKIDALVLTAYDLPPRLERKLLDYFRGSERPVPFEFGDYFPEDFRPCFSLAEYLSEDFHLATLKEIRSRHQPAPQEVLRALKATEKFAKGELP